MKAAIILLPVAFGTAIAADLSTGYLNSSPSVLNTTICRIDANPDIYDNRVVRLNVRVEAFSPESIHHVFDESCMRHALRLAGPDPTADRLNLSTLNSVLMGDRDGITGTKDKAVRAIITGRFSARQTLGVQAYTLYPISVEDIRVRYGESSLIPSLPPPPDK